MSKDYSISLLCECLGVSRSGYYTSRTRKAQVNLEEKALVEAMHQMPSGRRAYGYRRMSDALKEQGFEVNPKRVYRLMGREGLLQKKKKRYKPKTTDSSHSQPIAPNLLKQLPRITGINQAWQADITYIPTLEGWLYLAVVIDSYSRRILGYNFSDTLHAKIAVKSLQMATHTRSRMPRGVIFHSDRGSQYASSHFRNELKYHGFKQSMSAKGNCYDNALAESFFSRLKNEAVHDVHFSSRQEAKEQVFEWMMGFYNSTRIHSSLKSSPIQFENNMEYGTN